MVKRGRIRRLVMIPRLKRTFSPLLDNAVYQRDRGLCCKCGRDTDHLRRQMDAYHAAALGQLGDELAAKMQTGCFIRALFPEFAHRWPHRLWDRHHKIALAEGGTEAMDNQETVCVGGCHQRETAALAVRLAKARRLRSFRPVA